MKDKRATLGDKGEQIAATFLKESGYHIIERNYRVKCGEIDIVAQDADELVFVEVKTRTSKVFGCPSEAVNWRKQKQISKAALCYINQKKLHDTPARFDVVSILHWAGKTPEIELIQNAFDLSYDG